jgi:hypothetical protein
MLMRAAPRSGSLAIHIPLVLPCTLLLFPTAAMAETNQARASTDNSVPAGLVVVIRNKPDQTLDLRALNNPTISGIAFQIHWSDIEPMQGKPDWSKLDQLFNAAESFQLLVFPGFFPWMGPRRRGNRTVPNTIWTWQRHSDEGG